MQPVLVPTSKHENWDVRVVQHPALAACPLPSAGATVLWVECGGASQSTEWHRNLFSPKWWAEVSQMVNHSLCQDFSPIAHRHVGLHCRMCCSSSGLYMLGANSTYYSWQKNIWTLPHVPQGATLLSIESHCFRQREQQQQGLSGMSSVNAQNSEVERRAGVWEGHW